MLVLKELLRSDDYFRYTMVRNIYFDLWKVWSLCNNLSLHDKSMSFISLPHEFLNLFHSFKCIPFHSNFNLSSLYSLCF